MSQLLQEPFEGLIGPMLAVIASSWIAALLALGMQGAVPGLAGLVLASLLGIVLTFLLLWVLDRRFGLGFDTR